MKITRKGYYTIIGPDGVYLLNESGSLRQVTSRDECYERITEDGRLGTFTIRCPEREVEVEGAEEDEDVSVIVTGGSSGSFSYTATHYAAPYASVSGAISDDDGQNATAYSNATSPSTPCTIECACQNVTAGDVVQFAPGVYQSTATASSGDNSVPHWRIENAGTVDNPIVFTAENPGAYNSGNVSLLSELRQDGYGTQNLSGGPDPILGTNRSYVRIDGFYVDEGESLCSDGSGAIHISGGYSAPTTPVGGQITRCFFNRRPAGDYENGYNGAPIWFTDCIGALCSDNLMTGNGNVFHHNCGAIQMYRSQDLTVECNTISGGPGIFMKAEVFDSGTYTTGCVVRYNMVTDATSHAMRFNVIRELDVYQNIFHSENRALWAHMGRGTDTFDTPYTFRNNLVIGTGNRNVGTGAGVVGDFGAQALHIDETEVKDNIFIDASPTGAWMLRFDPVASGYDDIDAMARFNFNGYHLVNASTPRWTSSFESNEVDYTTFGAWQTYAATFGTSPVYTSEIYENDSIYDDPEFTSANYSDIPSGDWSLADNAQPALTASSTGGPIGLYPNGVVTIGVRPADEFSV